jgi:hypothetical protein
VAAQVKPPHHAASAWLHARHSLFRLFLAAVYQGYQVPRMGELRVAGPTRWRMNSSRLRQNSRRALG